MRKILGIIFWALIAFAGHAQSYQPVNTYGFQWQRGKFDKALLIPLGTGSTLPSDSIRDGAIRYNPTAAAVQVWKSGVWVDISTAGSVVAIDSARRSNDTLYFRYSTGGELAVNMDYYTKYESDSLRSADTSKYIINQFTYKQRANSWISGTQRADSGFVMSANLSGANISGFLMMDSNSGGNISMTDGTQTNGEFVPLVRGLIKYDSATTGTPTANRSFYIQPQSYAADTISKTEVQKNQSLSSGGLMSLSVNLGSASLAMPSASSLFQIGKAIAPTRPKIGYRIGADFNSQLSGKAAIGYPFGASDTSFDNPAQYLKSFPSGVALMVNGRTTGRPAINDSDYVTMSQVIGLSGVDTVLTVAAMQSYAGSARILLVKDTLRGGWFMSKGAGIPDNGITFSGISKYWVRVGVNNQAVNVLWYGAIPDDAVNDNAAFTAAVATKRAVYVPDGSFLITTNAVVLNDNQTIYGNGQTSIIYTTTLGGIRLVDMGNFCTVKDLKFVGTNSTSLVNPYTTPAGSQIAVRLVAKDKGLVTNCYFKGLGAGMYIENIVGLLHEGSTILGCKADSCFNGFYSGPYGEYVNFVGCHAYGCTYGLHVIAGNTTYTGGSLNNNRVGVWVKSDRGNDAHGKVTSCEINHNLDHAIIVDSTLNSFLFADNMIYYSNIYIKDAVNGVRFLNNDISSMDSIKVRTSTNVQFNGNIILTVRPKLLKNWNGTNNSGTLSGVTMFNTKYVGVAAYPESEQKSNQLFGVVNVDSFLIVSGSVKADTLASGTSTPSAKLHVVGTSRFDLSSDTKWDMFYRDSATGNLARLPAGSYGQFRYSGPGGVPQWRTLVSADIPALPFSQITGTVPVVQGGTGLTSLGSAFQQLRVNAGATALEYFTPINSGELSGTIYGDGTMTAFPTGVSYLILNPTANNTIDLSTGATYIGAAGRVAMIFNPTNYTFQIHGVTISNHFVYVVWTATNSPGFINL